MHKVHARRDDGEAGGDIYLSAYLLVRKKGGGWKAAGAAFGLAGWGLLTSLAIVLWLGAKFVGPQSAGATLNSLSTLLIALAFPALALGACCLDLLEKPPSVRPPAARRGAADSAGGGLRSQPHQGDRAGRVATGKELNVAEQIVVLFFYACGAALIVHNKTLVLNSLEFMPRARRGEKAEILFNRILCVLAGCDHFVQWAANDLVPRERVASRGPPRFWCKEELG